MIEPLESRRLLSVTILASSSAAVTPGRLDLASNKLIVSNRTSAGSTLTTYNTGTGLVLAHQTASPTDALVMYTYAGDANLDGKVDGNDYFNPYSGGDFNYDGKINPDDYVLIDSNYYSSGGGGVSAVGGTQTDFSGTAKNDRIYISNYGVSASLEGQIAVGDSFLVTINGQQTVTSARNLRINANAGDDYVSVNLDANDADVHVTIYGAAGNDTILGGVEADRIFAGEGNDSVCGGDGKDNIYGEAGDDSIRGGGSNDLLDGGDGADTLRGDAGNDNLAGGANSDRLRGSAGNDTLDGGGGRDFLAGEDGDDSLMGGAGDDQLDGGAGADFWNGGSGYDYIHAQTSDISKSSGADPVLFDQGDDRGSGGIVVQATGSNVSSTVDLGGLTKTGGGTLILPGSSVKMHVS